MNRFRITAASLVAAALSAAPGAFADPLPAPPGGHMAAPDGDGDRAPDAGLGPGEA